MDSLYNFSPTKWYSTTSHFAEWFSYITYKNPIVLELFSANITDNISELECMNEDVIANSKPDSFYMHYIGKYINTLLIIVVAIILCSLLKN